jgi:hypothetical protein
MIECCAIRNEGDFGEWIPNKFSTPVIFKSTEGNEMKLSALIAAVLALSLSACGKQAAAPAPAAAPAVEAASAPAAASAVAAPAASAPAAAPAAK